MVLNIKIKIRGRKWSLPIKRAIPAFFLRDGGRRVAGIEQRTSQNMKLICYPVVVGPWLVTWYRTYFREGRQRALVTRPNVLPWSRSPRTTVVFQPVDCWHSTLWVLVRVLCSPGYRQIGEHIPASASYNVRTTLKIKLSWSKIKLEHFWTCMDSITRNCIVEMQICSTW